MKCEQVRDMLSSYIDGMTSEKDNTAISAHLENCSQCRQELEHLRSIRIALKNLSAPELPESFAEDLRKRLADEKTILFGPRKIKKPKKQGWIAAGVAGVALVVGIYASSALPLAPMIASWQDKHNKVNDNKPSVAINEIISRIYNGKEEKSTDVAQAPEVNPEKTRVTDNDGSKKVPAKTTDEQDGETKGPDVSTAKVVTPKLADVFSTRLKVQNAGDSLKQVVQLAQSNGWNYEYTDNGTVPQALSGPNANGLAIKVNENDVDKVIGALGGVGKASSPMHSRVELTEQYSELETQINSLQEKKQNLQQAECPDQAKISEIEQQIQDSLKQKAALDKELQIVTVNIYFVEDVNP
ncbi:zf-HC2 domain-containing protein [Syntrophomonas curvata]